MPQRSSSSSSSSAAAAVAAESSRQRLKRSVLDKPPATSRRRITQSSSSLAQQPSVVEPASIRVESSRKRTRASSKSDNESAAAAEPSEAGSRSRRRSSSSSSSAAAAASEVKPKAKKAKSVKKSTTAKQPKAVKAASTSKKPKKVDVPLEISSCGICFEETFEHAGVLNCCQHMYCCACITQWAKSSNTCPQCKRRITSIAKTTVSTGKKVSTTKMKRRDLNDSAGAAHAGFMPGLLEFPGQFMFNPELQLLPHSNHMNPFLYHIILNSLNGIVNYDDDDDEDDEDFDPYETNVCEECGMENDGYGCSGCYGDGYDEGDYYDEEGDWTGDDEEEDDGRGTRNNPIEID